MITLPRKPGLLTSDVDATFGDDSPYTRNYHALTVQGFRHHHGQQGHTSEVQPLSFCIEVMVSQMGFSFQSMSMQDIELMHNKSKSMRIFNF